MINIYNNYAKIAKQKIFFFFCIDYFGSAAALMDEPPLKRVVKVQPDFSLMKVEHISNKLVLALSSIFALLGHFINFFSIHNR